MRLFPYSFRAVACLVAACLISCGYGGSIRGGGQAKNGSDEWRRFRGPKGSGVSMQKGLPTEWSAAKNLVWKTALPGPGSSSPIVVGDRIYLTCYSGYALNPKEPGDPKKLKCHLLCFDGATGRIVWDKSVQGSRGIMTFTGFMREHGYASSTPTSDGEMIYAFFGNWGVYAFDRDGRQVWHADCGERIDAFGSGASPVLHGDHLIVNASVESQSLIALDKKTGKEAWRAKDIVQAWNTPVLVETSNRTELALTTRTGVMGFDANTGRSLWRYVGGKTQTYVCPSLVAGNGILFGMSSYSGPFVAVRPGGTGDVSESHNVWKSRTFRTTTVSPVYHDGYLYYPNDNDGQIACFDAKTGEEKNRVGTKPNGGRIYASPLVANGKIYVVTRRNGTYVFNAMPKLEQIAHNVLDGDDSQFNGSPAPFGERLVLRSDRFLYCVGKR